MFQIWILILLCYCKTYLPPMFNFCHWKKESVSKPSFMGNTWCLLQFLISEFLLQVFPLTLDIRSSDIAGLAGQQIRYKIGSFQNANFLISQPNPMMLPLIGIVSERRFQWGSHHRIWLRNEKVTMKTV